MRRRRRRRLAGNPARIQGPQIILQEQRVVVPLHHHQLVLGDALLRDVPRLPRAADADALALPDGVEGKADVLTQRFATFINYSAGDLREVAVQELPERPLADEADAGRVLLRVVRQPGLEREAAHFAFLQLADREHDARELLLRQAVQEI